MTHHQIEVDGITIEILRKPIKNMHLRIYPPDGRVQISAPLKLSLKTIRQQLEMKLEWLHKHRARLQAQPITPEPTIQTGEFHHFLGRTYTLNVIDSPRLAKISLKDDILLLSIKPHSTVVEKKALLTQWYRSQMQSLVPLLIAKWQPLIGVSVASWGTKIMKTRWGSCNIRTRRIWLNLGLIKKPIACLEYVLVHEMVHLLEASHNARFHQLMDTFMPEWRDHKKLLYISTS